MKPIQICMALVCSSVPAFANDKVQTNRPALATFVSAYTIDVDRKVPAICRTQSRPFEAKNTAVFAEFVQQQLDVVNFQRYQSLKRSNPASKVKQPPFRKEFSQSRGRMIDFETTGAWLGDFPSGALYIDVPIALHLGPLQFVVVQQSLDHKNAPATMNAFLHYSSVEVIGNDDKPVFC
jgi:hypothetical protein